MDRRLGRRPPRTGRVQPARPGPARDGASAGSGQAGPTSLRTILYLQRDSNTSLYTRHASPAASSPTPGPSPQWPTPGPWRNGDPEPHRLPSRVLVRPRTLGSAPAIRSRSVRPRPRAGRSSGPGAKAIRNPTGCPAGPRASVSYRGPRRASRCRLLVPSFKWAAPGSGAKAIRNPTGCPVESGGRAARQPAVTS